MATVKHVHVSSFRHYLSPMIALMLLLHYMFIYRNILRFNYILILLLKYIKNIIFRSHLLNSFPLIFFLFKTSLINGDWGFGDLPKLVLKLITHINTNKKSSR
jgi:hypothetical protein